MKLFLIYPNQKAIGIKPIGLSILKAALARAGHEIRIYDVSRFNLEEDERERKEEMHIFQKLIPGEKLPERNNLPLTDVIADLLEELERFKPDFIGASVLTANFGLARQLLMAVREKYDTPIMVGGIHATVCPEEVLGETMIDIVAVGEADRGLVELADDFAAGRDYTGTPGFWFKDAAGEITRNEVAPLPADLNDLPYPDWSDFSELQFYKPYHGKTYRMGDVERSRGCPYKCSYCVAAGLAGMYGNGGNIYRQKSNQRLIAELVYLKETYGIEFFRFWDESFLLLSEAELTDLSKRYRAEVALPFLFETTARALRVQVRRPVAVE